MSPEKAVNKLMAGAMMWDRMEILFEDIILWCRCGHLWLNGPSVTEARAYADNHDIHCSAEVTVEPRASTIMTDTATPSSVFEPSVVPVLLEPKVNEEDSDRVNWREQAACLGSQSDVFFPVGRGAGSRNWVMAAKRICASCPVRPECLSYAVTTIQPDGVWGGTTPKERQKLRREAAAMTSTTRGDEQ